MLDSGTAGVTRRSKFAPLAGESASLPAASKLRAELAREAETHAYIRGETVIPGGEFIADRLGIPAYGQVELKPVGFPRLRCNYIALAYYLSCLSGN